MLAVYIHIPFCSGKCRYCGFYSTLYRTSAGDGYLDALDMEFGRVRELLQDSAIGSIYIGGGTPTVLPEHQLRRLLTQVHERLPQQEDRECTVEANPESASFGKLSLLRDMGVNRLSLGIQSLSDQDLVLLGRPHTSREGMDAFENARRAGFPSVGMDLIYGIPGQTQKEWENSLRGTIGLGPDHLSIYALSVDEGSRLAADLQAGRVAPPDDDVAAGMYESALDILAASGFEQYELSNFARPSHVCRHNSNYWDRGEYLGLGASAWSFIGSRRSRNIADLHAYQERIRDGEAVVDFEEDIGPEDAGVEALFLGLRRTTGIDLAACAEQLREQGFLKRVNALIADGFVEVQRGRLCLTPRGMLLSNEAIERMLP